MYLFCLGIAELPLTNHQQNALDCRHRSSSISSHRDKQIWKCFFSEGQLVLKSYGIEITRILSKNKTNEICKR